MYLGEKYIQDHPKYSLLWSNCQHFFRSVFDNIINPDTKTNIPILSVEITSVAKSDLDQSPGVVSEIR